MEMCPEAKLIIAAGMKNGEMRPGPPCRSLECSRSITSNPPIPLATYTPVNSAISTVIFNSDMRMAKSVAAASASWMNRGDFLELFFLGPVERIKVADFPGDGAIEGGGIEMGDRADAALARQQILPDLIGADPQIAYKTYTRYHNPAAHLINSLLVVLQRPLNYFLPCFWM